MKDSQPSTAMNAISDKGIIIIIIPFFPFFFKKKISTCANIC